MDAMTDADKQRLMLQAAEKAGASRDLLFCTLVQWSRYSAWLSKLPPEPIKGADGLGETIVPALD